MVKNHRSQIFSIELRNRNAGKWIFVGDPNKCTGEIDLTCCGRVQFARLLDTHVQHCIERYAIDLVVAGLYSRRQISLLHMGASGCAPSSTSLIVIHSVDD